MAESLALLGLASNILSFIEFGHRVVKETQCVRDSLHGTTVEAHELELIVEDVEKSNEMMIRENNAQANVQAKLSPAELRIISMVV